MCQLFPVPFHGDTIFCIDYQNQPYTPMKPIVENMGLVWAAQSVKLNANKERWGVSIIEIPSNGGEQEMLCMPVRKLPSYLNSINPRKVRPELRAKIELYQQKVTTPCGTTGCTAAPNVRPRRRRKPPSPLTSNVRCRPSSGQGWRASRQNAAARACIRRSGRASITISVWAATSSCPNAA